MENDIKIEGLEIPEGLSKTGILAAKTIISVLKKHSMTDTGGCTTFYSPKQWEERGEV